MSMLQEFKEFALKGNVVDLAVGIIIGAAFTVIVTSLVDDILMPPIGVLLGGIDFSDKYIQLTGRDQIFASLQAARDGGAAVIAYGNFINAVIKFVIVAFALFMVIKQMNNLKRMTERKVEDAPSAPEIPADIALLTEIRDALKSGGRPTVV